MAHEVEEIIDIQILEKNAVSANSPFHLQFDNENSVLSVQCSF